MVIHFGTNPVNGGIPLSDNSNSGIEMCNERLSNLFDLFILIKFLVLNSKKSGVIISEYRIKYIIAIVCLIMARLIIHPKCVIDEYAIIARNLDWFIPIAPPINALNALIIIINLLNELNRIIDKNTNGANFCQVDRIRQFSQDMDDITDGYHRWNGAAPILRLTLINRMGIIMVYIDV